MIAIKIKAIKSLNHKKMSVFAHQDNIFVRIAQKSFFDVIQKLTSLEIGVDLLLDIAVRAEEDCRYLYYTFLETATAQIYCVSFKWSGAPIVSLHTFFKNSLILQKEVYESYQVNFLDMWEHSVLYPGECAENEFEKMIWPYASERGVCVMRGQKLNGKIKSAYVQPGFFARQWEKHLRTKTYLQGLVYMGRWSAATPFVHEHNYALHMEGCLNITVPPYSKWLRIVLLEGSRIYYSGATLMQILESVGYRRRVGWEDLYSSYRRALGALKSEFRGYFICPGGVHHAMSEHVYSLHQKFEQVATTFFQKVQQAFSRDMVHKRMAGLGVVGSQEALALGVTGPVLRATGCAFDWRVKRPYDAYVECQYSLPVEEKGCAYTRAQVLIEDVRVSLSILNQGLVALSDLDFSNPTSWAMTDYQKIWQENTAMMQHMHFYREGIFYQGEHISCVEGPNGVVSMLMVGGGSYPSCVKMRSSSLSLAFLINSLAKDVEEEDLPVMAASMGLSMSELDR